MRQTRDREAAVDRLRLPPGRRVEHDSTVESLCECALRRNEVRLTAHRALVCETVPHTGRSPKDKYIVHSPAARDVDWGAVNQPLPEPCFDALESDIADYLAERHVFVQDRAAGADPAHRVPVRVVAEFAWHALFARHLLRPADGLGASSDRPLTVVAAPGFSADPRRHGTRSDVVIAMHLDRRLVLIAGTRYAGEIKKSVFTFLNYLLPARGVLPMHCSANVGAQGDVALFFGLSGTGKTTLSSDPARRLIGDDEHGWSPEGIFNFEGGCYAKLLGLSADAEPQIFSTTRRAGAVLENVVVNDGGLPDFSSAAITENTRGAYPLDFVDHLPEGHAGHPRAVVFLAADAFGVLPPVARLTPEQAMYHFLSGYTARVAGTERGVTDPVATFSACFGAPFLPRRASVYAQMLGERLARHRVPVWLVNTGWTGGPFGVGRRMPLRETRAIVSAILSGAAGEVPMRRDPTFGFEVPTGCPGVDTRLLDPRSTWADPSAYDAQARRLAEMFAANFAPFVPEVGPRVRQAGPRI